MRRRTAALLAPIAIIGTLAGCSSSAASSSNDAVSVSGTAGNAPTISIPAQPAATGLVTKTLVKGHGQVLTAQDSYLANFTLYIWRGKTHKLLFSSYKTAPEVLPVTMGLPGLQTALKGQRVGSRVLAVLPPKYGYGTSGNPQIGVKPTDTLVWVFDLLQAFPPTASASGQHITDGGGSLPKVAGAPGTTPQLVIPTRTPPPGKLVVTTLIKGAGAPVNPGQAIVVRYIGAIWRTGKTFNDNWPSVTSPAAPPSVFMLGQLIPAWNTGLVGVPVGSRVMLVVPPAEGYGKAGQPSAGISGTDTLVFLVDVLAIAK